MRLALLRHPGQERSARLASEPVTMGINADPTTVVINGRFIAQTQTGVQRYARQIVQHWDQLLKGRREKAQLVVPRGSFQPIDLHRIDVCSSAVPGGVLWEQSILPLWGGRPTVNLCNTAPILANRSIVCIHDCNIYDAADAYTRAFKTYYRVLLPLLVRLDARITTVSRHSAEQIATRLNIPLKAIHVLPNGSEHALLWQPTRSAFKPGLDTDTRPFVLLLGTLAKHKNASFILEMSDPLKALGVRIKVVGVTSGIYARSSLAHDDNVDWLGRVSDDDLALLLDRAMCLAFPSKNEGFGLPVLEAMARGCPVLASNRSSLPEVCGDAALLADPEDPRAWMEQFKRLAASRDLRCDLAGRGRERSRIYSWHTSAEGYRELAMRNDG